MWQLNPKQWRVIWGAYAAIAVVMLTRIAEHATIVRQTQYGVDQAATWVGLIAVGGALLVWKLNQPKT